MVQAALDAIAKLNHMEVGGKRIQVHHTPDMTSSAEGGESRRISFFFYLLFSFFVSLSLWQAFFTEHSNTRRPVWPVVCGQILFHVQQCFDLP